MVKRDERMKLFVSPNLELIDPQAALSSPFYPSELVPFLSFSHYSSQNYLQLVFSCYQERAT